MNELVNCRCGGEADVHFIGNTYIGEFHKFIGKYFICCEECGIKTSIYNSKKEAIEVWNKAMGEQTAIVKSFGHPCGTYGYCSNCGGYCVNEEPYCPHCGAKVKWE